MRPLRSGLGITLAALITATSSSASLIVASSPSPVVVRQSGFSEQVFGHQSTDVSWGTVLTNPSRTRDALDVTVTPTLIGANGKPVDPNLGAVLPEMVKVIPAGQTVYVGDDGINLRSTRSQVRFLPGAHRPT